MKASYEVDDFQFTVSRSIAWDCCAGRKNSGGKDRTGNPRTERFCARDTGDRCSDSGQIEISPGEYAERTSRRISASGRCPVAPGRKTKVCFLHVDENLKHKFVGTQGFQELKKTTKEENREFREKVRKQDPKLFDELIAKIEEKSDQQLEMDVPEILLLKAHSETPLMLSYSTIYTVRFSDKTGLKKMVRGCTMTDLDPAGKVLLMICDAPQAEVEWTRNRSGWKTETRSFIYRRFSESG